MKKLLSILLFLWSATYSASGQQVSQVNFDAIKTEIQAANSPFYYPALLKRFQAADTTLTAADFTHLYYGQVFSADYSPYGSIDAEFTKLYNKGEYRQALPLGEKYIAAHPLSLKMMFKLLVCHDQLENKPVAKTWAFRYFSLVNSIKASGDGKSMETAYVVATVSDEYEVLATLDLHSSRQSLEGRTDVLTVTPDNAKNATPSEMYFNVSQPLAALSREFKKK